MPLQAGLPYGRCCVLSLPGWRAARVRGGRRGGTLRCGKAKAGATGHSVLFRQTSSFRAGGSSQVSVEHKYTHTQLCRQVCKQTCTCTDTHGHTHGHERGHTRTHRHAWAHKTHKCVHTYTHTHTHRHTWAHTWTHECAQTHMSTHRHRSGCTDVGTHRHECTHTGVCIHTHVGTHIQACAHTHRSVHTHTHTQECTQQHADTGTCWSEGAGQARGVSAQPLCPCSRSCDAGSAALAPRQRGVRTDRRYPRIKALKHSKLYSNSKA